MSLSVRILTLCIISLLPSLSFSANASSFIDFFVSSDQKPMVGLSCSSEKECQTLCNGSENCQKPLGTCLSCIGSKSPYLSDFFSNMGDSITACFDEVSITQESENLFHSVSMIPLTPSSPYNPLGLKDLGLVLKFMTLCPAGTVEPIAVAFTDTLTHEVLDIPIIKCGQQLFPLVRLTEDCAKKTEQIHNFIRNNAGNFDTLKSNYEAAVSLADQLPLDYELLPFSEFSETQYIRCDDFSKAICQSLCHSSISCSIPIDGLSTAKAITAFNKHKWTTCGVDRFSPQILVDYLKAPDTVSFSFQSLDQSYDLPEQSTGSFFDFSIINSILNEFSDVFTSGNSDKKNPGSSFFVSTHYRDQLKKQMQALCSENIDPIILGHGKKTERVFCRAGINGYFQTLVSEGETCESKRGSP